MTEDSEVRIPAMRDTLVHYMRKLSDHELQRRVWSKDAQKPDTEHDAIEFVLDFIYLDTDLDEGADRWIGDMLKNEKEARAVERVVEALDKVYAAHHEEEVSDWDRIETEEWKVVLATAKEAFELMKE